MSIAVARLSYPAMKWAVVGGGPSGIGAVGKLVDAGEKVIWIDPNFGEIGRMGKYYRGVPANTPNASLCGALTSCQSFEIETFYQSKAKSNEVTLRDLPPDECSQLGYLVDVLEHASSRLQSHPLVTVIIGTVTNIGFKVSWTVSISLPDDIYTIQTEADCILLACGAKPIIPPNLPSQSYHKVDFMVNPIYVQEYFSLHPEFLSLPWAVVGSSHSAMLVIKNFVEVGVQHLVNFYRSDFIFEEMTDGGWYRNRGTGLKGPVGDWVKNELQNYSNVTRVRLHDDTELLSAVPQYEARIVYCCGYARNDKISIKIDRQRFSTEDLNRYNRWTGEIDARSRLYGVGIAFPQYYQHEDGSVELWVGFRRSMTQVDSILKELSLISD